MPAAIAVIGLTGLASASALSSARQGLSQARSAVEEAHISLAGRDPAAAGEALDRADTSLSQATSRVRSLPLRIFAPVPVIGSPIKALAAGTEAGRQAVAAGRLLGDALHAFPTSGTGAGVDGHDLAGFHEAAATSVVALAKASAHLDSARRALRGPAGATLPSVSSAAKQGLATLDDTQAQLDSVGRGLSLLDTLSDPATDLRLLLLAQDSMELRPTGGFIGSFGVLHFGHGTVELERYDSFGALPDPEPPMDAPAEYTAQAVRPWDLSNSNWWPDFPTSATTAIEMFDRQGGGDVDGVLAVTEEAMARLVGALGPIDLPGFGKPVTEAGFAQRVLYEVELKRPQDVPRKKFLIELSAEIFHRLFDLEAQQVPAVAQALGKAAGAGDVQLYFSDPTLRAAVEGTSLSGALPEPAGDFLLLAETNMSAGKANAELTRAVDYTVRQAKGGRLHANLRIEYHNDGPQSEVNPYYNGLVRVYVPQGSELADGSDSVADAPDGPYSVLQGSVVVDPGGGKHVLTFDYVLPETVVEDGHYHLAWLRQPGTSRDTYRAVVDGRSYDAEPGATSLSVDLDLAGGGESLLDRLLPG